MNGTDEIPVVLSPEAAAQKIIDDKVAELAPIFGRIIPITIETDEKERITGYFKPAGYQLTLYLSDCVINKEMSKGGEAIIHNALIKEHSDPRITDTEGHPTIAASFVLASMRLMKLFTSPKRVEEVKKN
jgi:hypothetical protein